MGPAVGQIGRPRPRGIPVPSALERRDRTQSREPEDARRTDNKHQHRHLDFLLLDLLPEILRRAPHHQPGNKDRQDGKQQHSVQSRADSAKDDLAELDVEQRHEAVVHAIDRPAAGGGRDRCEQRRGRNPEPHLLSLHVPPGLLSGCSAGHAQAGDMWIARLFAGVGCEHAGDKEDAHRPEEGPTLACVAHHSAERVRQPGRKQKDQDQLGEIC